ncbi:hypothetical protein NDU88_007559 [Pleurodeles waltl]|uniref:Uncharacterized protein n=1 Tax=Pleurodeles waltl TaxID=8319 RepID=A0AAV7U0E0_PLEWA|nr:hypothetical protein NDU88_007559 [Pleurodeles waltl]
MGARRPPERPLHLASALSAVVELLIRAERACHREPVDPRRALVEEACPRGGVALLRHRSRLADSGGD